MRGVKDSEEYLMGNGANDRRLYVQVMGIFNGSIRRKQVVGFQTGEILEDSQ